MFAMFDDGALRMFANSGCSEKVFQECSRMARAELAPNPECSRTARAELAPSLRRVATQRWVESLRGNFCSHSIGLRGLRQGDMLQASAFVWLSPSSRLHLDPARLRLHHLLSSTEWGSPSASALSQFDTARAGGSGTGEVAPGG